MQRRFDRALEELDEARQQRRIRAQRLIAAAAALLLAQRQDGRIRPHIVRPVGEFSIQAIGERAVSLFRYAQLSFSCAHDAIMVVS